MAEANDGTSMEEQRLSRRELLKKAGVGAAALGVSGAAAPFSFAGPMRYKGRWLKGDLSIIQWVHFVPSYDDWFDNTFVIHEGAGLVKVGVMVRGWWCAGSLAVSRRGRWGLQSSIRLRGAGQSVVRCSGAQSSGRPSLG